MRRLWQKVSVYAFVAALSLPVTAWGESARQTYERSPTPPAEAMVVDAVVVRPVMLATTVIGAAVFVVSLPFTVPGGNVSEAGEKLVGEPARYTFRRPLGHFDR